MQIYSLEYIYKLKNENNFELESNVLNFLNNTLSDIKKQTARKFDNNASSDKNRNKFNKYKNYEKKSDSKNNSFKNSNIFEKQQNENITKNRINRIKGLNNVSSIDAINNNIRKILNKLTNSNYEKLKNEFICYYNTLLTSDVELNEINILIFSILTKNNEIFSDLYSSIYSNLININDDFSILLNKNINNFLNFGENINFESTSNKKNDEYRCLLLFYINCIKQNLLPSDFIFDLLNILFIDLFDNFKITDNKNYCEVLNEFIFYIITNSYKIINDDKNYSELYKNIEKIKAMKNKDLPSISNKIIFKNMDLYEKYIPKNQ